MRKIMLLTLTAALLLSACGSAAASETSAAPETTAAETTEESTAAAATTEAQTFAPIVVTEAPTETTTVNLADLPADPPYDYDIDTMEPSDFGDFFWNTYDVTTSSYKILPGDSLENEVFVIDSGKSGPVIYVIAGIHGDEEAAWRTGNLLKKISIKSGKLYILSPANKSGAANYKRTLGGDDPNRAFPGDPDGSEAERYAYAVYNDVADKDPDFVFDLHEAIVVSDSKDYLGSSLIYSDMDLFGDLILDLVQATVDGEICNRAFTYYSPGPNGSINKTITEGQQRPVLTVETFRGYQMEDRISDQLDVVQYVMRYYGMVD